MSTPLDKGLHAILASAQLPTLPAVAAKVLELTSQEDAALADIVPLIVRDPALSIKILKVANSSLYSFPQRIASIQQAVALLGGNAVRNLVLSFTFLAFSDRTGSSRFDHGLFWERALIGATTAKLIANQIPRSGVDPDELFTIGLLRDIGQLLFALTVPERHDHLCHLLAANDTGLRAIDLEEEHLGVAHTTLGYEVALLWGLPPAILAAIRHHHDPAVCGENDEPYRLRVRIVALADSIGQLFFSRQPEIDHRHVEEEARLIGLDGLALERLLATLHREVATTAQFFEIPASRVRPVAEILQEANIRLSLLHLSYEEMHHELVRTTRELDRLRHHLAERNRVLEKLANIDGLTEIHNHRFFQNFLQSELNRARRNSSALALLLADIDHFKQFNDTHGHLTGDFILKEMGQAARPIIRQYDLMARYGGEEFAFVLPETGDAEALAVACALCRAIADHDFFDGQQHYRVTVSIGAVSILPATVPDLSGNLCIHWADQALYQAKKRGRNQAVLHRPQKTGALARLSG